MKLHTDNLYGSKADIYKPYQHDQHCQHKYHIYHIFSSKFHPSHVVNLWIFILPCRDAANRAPTRSGQPRVVENRNSLACQKNGRQTHFRHTNSQLSTTAAAIQMSSMNALNNVHTCSSPGLSRPRHCSRDVDARLDLSTYSY